MNTFCNDFHDCPQLEKVGKERERGRDCQWERKGEKDKSNFGFPIPIARMGNSNLLNKIL